MTLLDRYLLRQMVVAFVFFCLILAGVIWLTQAVRLIDTVLSAGQSLWRLIEFSTLVLPRVLSMVVPLSGFAAALYAVNKLYSESELVVMMTAGLGPFGLARPVGIFAIAIALLTLVITNFMAPAGELRLEQNRQQIRTELANALIREGRFLHPAKGLTIFIRQANEQGQMRGLFLHDERDPGQPVTYTAEQALLLRDGDLARLVMSRGIALTYSADERLLARVQFDEFVYDLSDLVQPVETGPNRASNLPTRLLLAPTSQVEALQRFNRGAFAAAGHERIVFGLHGAVLPILALAVMLTGGYQRRGFGKRVAGAVLAGVVLITASLGLKSVVTGNADLWPVFYLPDALGLALAIWMIWRTSRARSAKRTVAVSA